MQAQTNAGLRTISFTLDAPSGVLELNNAIGEAYSVTVTAEVSEPDGSSPMSAQSKFEPAGSFEGYRLEDQVKLAQCTDGILRKANVRERDLHIVRPGPVENPAAQSINQARLA